MREPLLGWIVWAGFGLWRLVEVGWARRNLARLLEQGGLLLPRDCLPVMVALHVGTMGGCAVERMLGARVEGVVSLVAGVALLLALAGRVWMHATLGQRWTVRVVVLPGETPIRHGPYRFLRHPNYWIIVLEVRGRTGIRGGDGLVGAGRTRSSSHEGQAASATSRTRHRYGRPFG